MNGEGVTRLDRTRDEAPSSCTNGVVLHKTNNYLHQDSPSASLYVSKKSAKVPSFLCQTGSNFSGTEVGR